MSLHPNEVWTRFKSQPKMSIEYCVKPARDSGMFAGEGKSIPFTPIDLISEISEKIPLIKDRCVDSEICVLYTVEWALWLVLNGFKRVTIVTRTHDPIIEKVVGGWSRIGEISEFKYMTEDKLGERKFDVVVGNPPYQDVDNSELNQQKRKGRSGRLYEQFFNSFFKKADFYGIVLPLGWLGKPGKLKNDILLDMSVTHLILTTPSFAIKIPTCAVIKNKNNTSEHVLIVNKEKKQVICNRKDVVTLDVDVLHISIMNKITIHAKLDNLSSIWNRIQDEYKINTSDPRLVQNGKTPVVTTTGSSNLNEPNIMFINESVDQRFFNSVKVITNTNASETSIGAIKIIKPNYLTSNSIVFFPVDTYHHAYNLKNYLLSNIVKFIASKKTSAGNTQSFFKQIPMIDITRSWTDSELYDHFNLTQEEIDLIEKTVK